MPERGDIVLVIFPFTDLSGEKRRPAVVVGHSDDHVVVLFITSRQTGSRKWRVALPPTRETGLKVASAVRVDKIASIDLAIITGAVGRVPTKAMGTMNAALKMLLNL